MASDLRASVRGLLTRARYLPVPAKRWLSRGRRLAAGIRPRDFADMFDYAQAAVEGALAAGAAYADARAMVVRQQGLSCLNENIEGLDYDESAGIGVRALIGSSWGFYATPDLTEKSARAAGAQAAAIALASGLAAGEPLRLLEVPVVTDHYETPFEEAPFDVALSEKADLLVAVNRNMRQV